MRTKELLDFYSREDVCSAIVSFGKGREVVGRRLRGDYNRRPDIIAYPGDVTSLAKDGATSFHASVELWKNPLALVPGMAKKEIDENRQGWDFLIDLDGKNLEHSKIAADLLVKALEAHGLSEIPVKFSGRAGFHIMVPYSLFPKEVNGTPSSAQFPEIPRMLAEFLQEFIRESFRERLLKFSGSPNALADEAGLQIDALLDQKKEIDPFKCVKIDSVLISPRHLVRAPYSFNEKSWLVSIPVDKKSILSFDKNSALPENVKSARKFSGGKGNARELLEAALIFRKRTDDLKKETEERRLAEYRKSDSQVERRERARLSEDLFPPCVRAIFSDTAVEDGRKRRLFILQGFLHSAGWSNPEIAEKCVSWNNSLKNPLPPVYLEGQLSYMQRSKKEKGMVAPNCATDGFYKEMGICLPDEFCSGVKNPITSAFRRLPRKRALEEGKRKEEEKARKREISSQKKRKKRASSPAVSAQKDEKAPQ